MSDDPEDQGFFVTGTQPIGATAPPPVQFADHGEPNGATVDASSTRMVAYEFIARLEVAETMKEIADRAMGPGSLHPAALTNLESAIQDSLAGIVELARAHDGDLAQRIEEGVNGEDGYPAAIAATQELVGWIRSAERHGSPGAHHDAGLALGDLHPWVHRRVVGLWNDQQRESAFAAAASDIFEVHLPDKLRVPAAEPERLVTLAFGRHHRGLKIPAYPTPGDDQDNAYQAARRLGLACARLLKLSTRGADIVREEVVQLEELAMLSRFARLIDEG
jgi:hypothetical protein